MEQKSVGIWVRVSTEDQAKGESPEHHEKRARLYAEAKGWNIVTVYHLEAMSGKSVMGYPETKRMMQDIRSGNITGLIFSKLARLARNTKELLDFADFFKAENADLISLQEAIDTSTPAGRLFYTMIAAMAQWEREEIADRVAASIPIRAKLGKSLGGRPSLGYQWLGNQFVIDEEFAPIRVLIYELFVKYKRKKTVANMLNERGYRSRNGKKFTDNSIYSLLRDPSAKGQRRANYLKKTGDTIKYKPAEDWVILPCPAIVSEDLWNECNRILDELEKNRKRPGPRAKHLLAGFVECSCERKMYVFHRTKTLNYICKDCNNRIPEPDLNEIFKEQLKTFLLTEMEVSDYASQLDQQLLEKEKLLEIVLTEKANLKKAIDGLVKMRSLGEMSKEMFKEQYQPLEERYLQLTEQLPELHSEVDVIRVQHQSSDVVLQDAKDLYSRWDELEYEDKRHIVELITEKIVIGNEDIHIKLSYVPRQLAQNPPANPDKITHEVNGGNSLKSQRGF